MKINQKTEPKMAMQKTMSCFQTQIMSMKRLNGNRMKFITACLPLSILYQMVTRFMSFPHCSFLKRLPAK